MPGRGGEASESEIEVLELVLDPEIKTVLAIEPFKRDFQCPVCLDLVSEATATECLHRFCTECIEKSLRLGYAAQLCCSRGSSLAHGARDSACLVAARSSVRAC
jgi:hypothetical protein